MCSNLSEGNIALIAGISFGMQPILASRSVGPAGCVVAVDPHPKALLRARQNILLNDGTDNIRLVSAALGAEGSIAPLGDIPDDHIGWGSLVTRDAGRLPFHVQVETIGSIFSRLKLPRLDMLVLDVIGYELPILSALLPPHIPKILMVAVHSWVTNHVGDSFEDFRKALRSFGYICRNIYGDEPRSAEDLPDYHMVGVLREAPVTWLRK
jgi:FkbM family methyltransferase